MTWSKRDLELEARRRDQQDELAFKIRLRQPRLDVRRATDEERFVEFGDFLGDTDHPIRTKRLDQFVHGFVDAMTALVECERVIKLSILGEEVDPGGAFGREKPDVEEPVGWQSAGAEHSGEGTRAGDRNDGQPATSAGANKAKPRVAQGRGAGVAHDRDGFSRDELIGEALGRLRFVVLMIGDQRLVEPQSREHSAGGARVFAGNQINRAQNGAGAIREVGEVANGSGHDIKMTGLGSERSVFHRRRGASRASTAGVALPP